MGLCQHTTLLSMTTHDSGCSWLYVRSSAVDARNLHIDQHAMDAVGRLGGHSYTRTQWAEGKKIAAQ